MAETRPVSITRDFIISGYLSGQAFRVAVRIDTTATRLIRLALKDFSMARGLEQQIVDALGLFDESLKAVRKDLDKANRRRREGIPNAGMKQDFIVRTLISAQAFRSAVMVDQIQRDLTLLSLAGSPQIAVAADKAQKTVNGALQSLDSVVSSVAKKLDEQNDRSRKRQASAPGTSKAKPNDPEKRNSSESKKAETPAPTAQKKERSQSPVTVASEKSDAPNNVASQTSKKTPKVGGQEEGKARVTPDEHKEDATSGTT